MLRQVAKLAKFVQRAASEVITGSWRFTSATEFDSYLILDEISAPSTPASGQVYIYATSTGLYMKDSGGTEYKLSTWEVV